MTMLAFLIIMSSFASAIFGRGCDESETEANGMFPHFFFFWLQLFAILLGAPFMYSYIEKSQCYIIVILSYKKSFDPANDSHYASTFVCVSSGNSGMVPNIHPCSSAGSSASLACRAIGFGSASADSYSASATSVRGRGTQDSPRVFFPG